MVRYGDVIGENDWGKDKAASLECSPYYCTSHVLSNLPEV